MELIIILIIWVLVLLSSIRISAVDERIVIFRFSRYFKVAGPGMVLTIPIIDRGIKIKLNEKIQGWKNLTREQLEKKIKRLSENNNN